MNEARKIVLATLLTGAASAIAGTQWDLKVGNRTATIYAPDKRDKPALVISMHGLGGGAWWSLGSMNYRPLADTANFVVAYPNGENSQWDLGGTKDINFIVAIIDSMARRYSIDRNRVYASGFSMGGMMSWYLSCKIPDKIAAIVPGNGFPLGGMSGCNETRHVPVLHIHGNADDFVKYTDFVNSFLPAQRTRYGCPTNPVRTKPYPANKPTSGSYMDVYGPCAKGNVTSEIRFLTVDGMIHDWATPGRKNENKDPKYTGKLFDVDGTWEAWNFMRTQSLTGPTGLADAPRVRKPLVSARMSEGRIQVASDLPLREVRIVDMQGKTRAVWEGSSRTDNLATFPAGSLKAGLYLLEARGDAGRTVSNLLVP